MAIRPRAIALEVFRMPQNAEPRTLATEIDVVRCVRHADQRARQLVWRIRADSRCDERSPCRRQGVLGSLGAPQYRALLAAIPDIPRDLQGVPCRYLCQLRYRGQS